MKIQDGTFSKKIQCEALEKTSGDMCMLSDLQLVYMVPRNSTQLLNINTTNFQVEREPVYKVDQAIRFSVTNFAMKNVFF